MTRVSPQAWVRHATPNALAPAAETLLETFPWANVHTRGDLLWHSDRLEIVVRPFVTFSLRGEPGNPLAQVGFQSACGTAAGETFRLDDPKDVVGAVSAVVGHFLEKSPLAVEPAFRLVLTWRKVFVAVVDDEPGSSAVSKTVSVPARTIVLVSPTARAWAVEDRLKPIPRWTFASEEEGAGPLLSAGVHREPEGLASVADLVRTSKRRAP